MEPFEGVAFFHLSDLGDLNHVSQDLDRPVIRGAIDRIRVPVFSAVGEAESGRIPPARFSPIHQFADQCERPEGFRSDAEGPNQGFEIPGRVFIRGKEGLVNTLRMDILKTDRVMAGKRQMLKLFQLSDHPVGML